jgi:hypothetical protein
MLALEFPKSDRYRCKANECLGNSLLEYKENREHRKLISQDFKPKLSFRCLMPQKVCKSWRVGMQSQVDRY